MTMLLRLVTAASSLDHLQHDSDFIPVRKLRPMYQPLPVALFSKVGRDQRRSKSFDLFIGITAHLVGREILRSATLRCRQRAVSLASRSKPKH